MIFRRQIYKGLLEWRESSNRKPLLLRGARQVGKTTVVNLFAKEFKHSILLNLERADDYFYFDKFDSAELIVESLMYSLGIPTEDISETLLFIDEIQESPKAIHLLRYFYEDIPDLYVIAAGSLLEFAMKKVRSVPVGRVEYLYMHPLNFPEYLDAVGHKMALEQYNTIPPKPFAFDLLLKFFNRFAIIGGMPETVSVDIETNSIANLPKVYESIWEAYLDDVEKYAANETDRNVIIHIMRTAPLHVDERVKFERFGFSDFRSREVSAAFRKLEKAKIIRLIYPATDVNYPALPNLRKTPRLQFLDTGLVNYNLGIQSDMLGIKDLSNSYKGAIIPHLITQELISSGVLRNSKPNFWVRDKSQASAEVDLLHAYKAKVVPVEIKSGPKGTLKSLHLFVDMSEHEYAVRMYAGEFQIEKSRTPKGKDYLLMNMPYYLGAKIPEYIAFFIDNYSIDNFNDAKVYKDYPLNIGTSSAFRESASPAFVKGGTDGVNDVVDVLIDGVNNAIIDGVNISDSKKVLLLRIVRIIAANKGIRARCIANEVGKAQSTIERYIKILREKELIIFKGAPKTGGYFVVKNNGNLLE